MAIVIACPDCHKKIKARLELVGKRAKCPSCGKILAVSNQVPASRPERDNPPVKHVPTNAKLIDDKVSLYSSIEADADVVMQLDAGMEIRLGTVQKANGQVWIQVIAADGQEGFILGSTKVKVHRFSSLLNQEVSVRTAPSGQAPVRCRLSRGATFFLVDVVKGDGEDWVKIRDRTGLEGFIDGSTKIE